MSTRTEAAARLREAARAILKRRCWTPEDVCRAREALAAHDALDPLTVTVRPLRARRPLFEATYGEIVRSVLWCREPKRRGRKVGA